MGSFFANVQVYLGRDPRGLETARDTITDVVGQAGLAPCAASEAADRTVVLSKSGGWLTVYDQAGDSQDLDATDALTQALSAACETHGFSVMVHDSDVLFLTLFDRGQRRDRYTSSPGAFGGPSRPRRPAAHVEAWRSVLPDREDALRAVFSSEALFAEAALVPLAQATGVPEDRLQHGYRTFTEQQRGGGAVQTLRFRRTVRPAWEQDKEGAPRLRTPWEIAADEHGTVMPEAAVRPLLAAQGAPLQLSLTARNTGGPGQGVRVGVSGGRDLVAWERAELVLGDPRTAAGERRPQARLVAEEGTFVADFPDAALPAGRASGAPGSPAEMMQQIAAQYAAQVHVNVFARALAAGEAEVVLSLAPRADPEAGTRWVRPIGVRSTEGRPLRAPQTVHPSQLDALEPGKLTLLVCLEGTRAQARVGALAEVLAPWVPQRGAVEATRFPATAPGILGRLGAALKQPRTSRARARGYLTGRTWPKLLRTLDDSAALIEVSWADDDQEASARLEAGRGMVPTPEAVLGVVVCLTAGEHEAEAARALADWVDGLCVEGGVHQGLLTSWAADSGVETNPYEQACGISGQTTLERRWVTRWLRAVGRGTLWLGPDLASHLDRQALAEAAQTRPFGEALRVEVSDVPAVERAVAAVLPSSEDWRTALQALYRP